MRTLLVVSIALAMLSGCSDCGGCLYRETPRPQVAAEGGGGGDAGEDAAADAEGPGRPDAARPLPGPSPLAIAQQFVVGWASGRLEPLLAISDGEAADMVRRAMAGEAVDTPFGPSTSTMPPASAFSFADRRAEVDAADHRISFTVTVRRAGGEPATSRHVVFVRRSDNKVVRWIAPSPLSDGGV